MSRRVRVLVALFVTTTSLGPVGCGSGGPRPAPPAEGGSAGPPAADRPVVHTAALEVRVDDLDAARAEVDRVMADFGGFVAKAEVRNTPGTRRSAVYALRVPADGFAAAVAELAALGVVERYEADSADVTEAVADATARVTRLRQQQPEPERVPGGGWVLAGRRATAAARADTPEVARAEGRRKALAERVAFASIALTLREAKDYVPPNAPSFDDRVRQAATDSWGGVVGFLEGVAVAAVALGPWLLVLIPAGVGLVHAGRAVRAWRHPAPVPGPAPPAPPPAG